MEKKIKIFKALSDKNRLLIIEMLSCGELCGGEIMEGLNLTQPTISHHMKILSHAGLVNCRKEGKWSRYSLDKAMFDEISTFIRVLSSEKEDCICNSKRAQECGKA